jgi:hypothetical protein
VGAWGEERGRAGPSGGAAAAGASDGERGSAAALCGRASSVVPHLSCLSWCFGRKLPHSSYAGSGANVELVGSVDSV